MNIEIGVVSTEIIPPSSPTPKDLSNYKFYFIDLLEVPAFMPLTLFYEATGNVTKSVISIHLKESLSETLPLYYPPTGRIVDNSYDDDDDDVKAPLLAAAGGCRGKFSQRNRVTSLRSDFIANLPGKIRSCVDIKIYAIVESGSLAITASTVDSLLDLMAGGILWLTRLSMKNTNTYKYLIGKLKAQPIGILVFATIMATLSLLVLIQAIKQLIERTSGDYGDKSVGTGSVVYCKSSRNEIVRSKTLTLVIGSGGAGGDASGAGVRDGVGVRGGRGDAGGRGDTGGRGSRG